MKIDTNSIAHTTWNCKYHIVFAPKYRRQVIYGKIKGDIGQIIRKLCEWKGVEIIEAEACPDHIHMLVSIPPKISVSSFMGYLKGKSSLMIFDKHANMKYRYGNREFWCRGYYVDTVGKNKKAIAEYPLLEYYISGGEFSGFNAKQLPAAMADELRSFMRAYITRRLLWCLGFVIVAGVAGIMTLNKYNRSTRTYGTNNSERISTSRPRVGGSTHRPRINTHRR